MGLEPFKVLVLVFVPLDMPLARAKSDPVLDSDSLGLTPKHRLPLGYRVVPKADVEELFTIGGPEKLLQC